MTNSSWKSKIFRKLNDLDLQQLNDVLTYMETKLYTQKYHDFREKMKQEAMEEISRVPRIK